MYMYGLVACSAGQIAGYVIGGLVVLAIIIGVTVCIVQGMKGSMRSVAPNRPGKPHLYTPVYTCIHMYTPAYSCIHLSIPVYT